MFTPELSDGSKWQLVYYQKHEAIWKTSHQYEPIPDILLPTTFDNPNLIVQPFNASAFSYWWLGARLVATTNVPGIDNYVTVYRRRLQINKKNYLHIPIESSYSISLSVPWKYTEMTFSI